MQRSDVTWNQVQACFLKESLIKLINRPVSGELLHLFHFILNPDSVVGMHFAPRWKDDSGIEALRHNGAVTEKVEEEFRLEFEEDHFCFFTVDELVVDIVRGDLEFHE